MSGIRYVRLLHEVAPLHTSLLVMQKSEVTVLPHLQTVPSLSIPYDFSLFPTVKKLLSGRCYESRQAFGSAISQCLAIKFQSQEYFRKNPYYFRSELVFQTARKTSREVMFIHYLRSMQYIYISLEMLD